MSPHDERTLGLLATTGIGVGAIVGGGIFVLAGVAYAAAGPAAIIAFGLNGLVAFLTAMSFAEIATAFPENGGAYTFAKKVLSVRAAFATGWIIWFAYIVAGVLYALGFASFAALTLQALWDAAGQTPPDWLFGRGLALLLASVATGVYALSLVRKSVGGGQWMTVGKVVIFVILILAGGAALLHQDASDSVRALSPFFSGGAPGLLMAMGFTFIALQGFDLIAAVAGEVKDPGRTIPRAMFLSLGCALVIYLPLLFLVAVVGVGPETSIGELATAQPENVIPIAAKRFMGPIGYWLVLIAAILSTLSALHANLLAASRVALVMARDRTLPGILAGLSPNQGAPVMAIYATALALVAIIFMVPNLTAAGAAASLIFLLAFTLTHITAFLARLRGGTQDAPYQTPWFPLIPIVGGLACGGLAIFQIVVAPDAGAIVMIWLGFGVLLYLSLFAHRAEVADAVREAHDPDLVRLRGHSPLVLVPVANPKSAVAMVSIANVLAAKQVGRVLLLSIVPASEDAQAGVVPPEFESVKKVVDESLRQSYISGYMPEMLITTASDPWAEIRRIAKEHQCESLLLGLSDAPHETTDQLVETLIEEVGVDITLMSAHQDWRLVDTQRVLVPVGGRGEQHEIRARFLGSICRTTPREITFVTVVRPSTSDVEVERVREDIGRLADLNVRGKSEVKILRSATPIAALSEEAAHYDLMVLGHDSGIRRKNLLGGFAVALARDATCATVILGRRPQKGVEILTRLRTDLVESIEDAVTDNSSRIARPVRH